MDSHDFAEEHLHREIEREAQEKALEDDLRQRMDALSAQEKTQLGTRPERRKELRFVDDRLEGERGREAQGKAAEDDLRQRMDGLLAKRDDEVTWERLQERGNLHETWRESEDEDLAQRRMSREKPLEDYEARCARTFGVDPARRDQFVFVDGLREEGSWDQNQNRYSIKAELLDRDSESEAANTIEHECSHRSDSVKGQAPEHYFSKAPDLPHAPGARGGVLICRPGQDGESYAAEYRAHA